MSPLTSPDAHVVLRTASALSGAHAKGAMIPEALLLALLHAPSIAGEGNGVVPEEDALRRAVRARALDPAAFDDEAGAPLPDARPRGELPREGRVARVALVLAIIPPFTGEEDLFPKVRPEWT